MMRRDFMTRTAAILGLGTAAGAVTRGATATAAEGEETFPLTRTESEWREMLSDAEYRVMREEGTERAFSSPLHDLKTEGTYVCRGCDQALYSSEHKFDSGTGWPSYWQPIAEDAVGTKPDRSFFMVRTEVHCSNCGSHLGHIFEDGPEPTGLRHCINGVSLKFQEA
ncbi:protein-methionine-S-oxide reductase [Roseivivax marinus]|uniref:peptide-methionine (R)-S-oxide reductase n=1 Tax=Roseivivax marinus TaxID=1379903 RepID=W4HKH9_9RHOB|nr:peptide-methionine (R)-S-oxide reductase MsrB [Roseivivax marinus]ETW12641.1 protein-methionine-S-oxide reductase [Roseivivax marinus]SEL17419.1 peptide-methionine (R)-S-oxide reductase [Roseivivax marinus]